MQKLNWKHVGPCEHVVQFYASDAGLMETLEAFLGAGLREGESAMVIATGAHLNSLEQRLGATGVDLARARSLDRYIPLDADKLFELFMHGGTFDSEGFFVVVGNALERCQRAGGGVRVYGELVALMWARKHYAIALRLEEAWQVQCRASKLAVLCSYPVSAIPEDSVRMIPDICAAHTEAVFE
jgi:hypothetical protein